MVISSITIVMIQVRHTERREPPHTNKTRYTARTSTRECQIDKPARYARTYGGEGRAQSPNQIWVTL